MTSYRAPRSRRLAVAVVAAAGVGLALPAHASAALEPVGHALHGPAATTTTPATSAATAEPFSAYHPLTRFTGYTSAGRVSPGHWVSVAVAGRGGVPAAGGFNALATTIIVSHATRRTTVAVSAPGTPSSTRVVTAQTSRTASGFALAAANAAGVTRFRLTGGHARVQVLVLGYQQAGSTGASFHPLAPASVLSPHRVAGGHSRLVPIVGSARTGLPSNGHVAAVALAVTVSRPTATTTVTANARGTSLSSGAVVVTAHRATTTSGLAIVRMGNHAALRLHNAHGHATLSAQVEGYWTTDPTGSFSRAVTPTIVYDGKTAANAWRTVSVAGQLGLRASQLSAAVLSITTGPPAAPAYLTVAPARTGFPTSGPIAVAAHSPATSVVVSRLSGPSVHVYANRRMRLTIRVVGYYGPTASGTDVSSSCSGSLTSGARFAVVQATNGKPYSTVDPSCFATELAAAARLPGAPEFYLNLADPGKASAGHWNDGGPKACHVAKNYDLGCAYDYGYQAAKQAVGFAASQGAASGSRWWVDVETDNSWGNRHLTDPPAHAEANIADIQGALHYLGAHGYPAGVYTETAWWNPITGGSKRLSNVPVWGGGADSAANARANCKQVSITGGPALLSQWFVKRSVDHDVAC